MRMSHTNHQDPQRAPVRSQCTRCGGEIYAGSSLWQLNGQILCRDCLIEWLMRELAPWHRICGEVEP